MLKGRLGIDSAKVPHKDRAGLLYLARGALTSRDGTLAFMQREATSADALTPGDHAIPLQGVSMILLGPGSTVSHDALRLLAHAHTALAAVGEDGVRFYTAPPLIPDQSGLARRQARLWAEDGQRGWRSPAACMPGDLVRCCRTAPWTCCAESKALG